MTMTPTNATIGLSNLGNTCGINTWLQTVFASPLCVQAINGSTFEMGTFGRCVQEIVSLWTRSTGSRRLMPTRLVNLIYEKSNGLFQANEQLDICELWMWALQQIHTDSAQPWDINKESFPDITAKKIADVAHKFQEGKKSKLLDTFHGIQMAVVKCKECDHSLVNVEPFTFVQLDIPCSEESFVLSELFNKYFEKEPMEEWTCDKCQKKEATKTLRFWSLPNVVVIVLKRFTTTSNGIIRKVHTNIDIPMNITFHKGSVLGDQRDHTYELKSMGLHHGTYNGGHYTSVVQHKGSWFHCDDEEVREIHNLADVTTKNRSSYVMIYERANFK